MDRRKFLRGAMIAVPAISATGYAQFSKAEAATLPLRGEAPAGFERVSCEKGDPGELAYGMACGDGKIVVVYLDGVKQKYVITADARLGFVKRHVKTPAGNIAINMALGEPIDEVVTGFVVIEIG